MEILTAVLCDSAADYNGKLCILGAFDTIWARKFPATHAHCAIALRFLFRDTDLGEHQFQVRFVDPDGRNALPSGPISLKVRIDRIPDGAFFLSRNVILNLQGLPLKEPALYSFDVTVDESIVARIPLQVVTTDRSRGPDSQGGSGPPPQSP